MRTVSAQLGRAHALPKIHEVFTNVPKIHPIIDTTNTPYYKIGHLPSLLQPLTISNYTQDSFDAANKIKSASSEIFKEGHPFVSFDVECLLTNVPLSKPINIILDRMYRQKLLKPNIKRITMKNFF